MHKKSPKSKRRSSPKKRISKKKKQYSLSGGSWDCPTFFKVCKLAEGKNWDETKAKFNFILDEINFSGLYSVDYNNENFGKFPDIVHNYQGNDRVGEDKPYEYYRKSAIKDCNKTNPSQAEHGKCIQSLNKLRYVVDSINANKKTPEQIQELKREKQAAEALLEEQSRVKKLKGEAEKRAYEDSVRTEYEKNRNLVKPYIDAFKLIGSASKELTKKFTDNLEVNFEMNRAGNVLHVEARLLNEQRYTRFVRMENIQK